MHDLWHFESTNLFGNGTISVVWGYLWSRLVLKQAVVNTHG